jgi:hypothetical protein
MMLSGTVSGGTCDDPFKYSGLMENGFDASL